jgi:hypothetical protein
VSCEDFTTAPAERDPPGRGRPQKATPVNPELKRPRGRPRKDAGDETHGKTGDETHGKPTGRMGKGKAKGK